MRPSEALELHREEIAAVLARYPVSDPRIFGSVTRGEDTEASDLDILVQRGEGLTYFDIAALEQDLRSLTGVRIDVRTEGEFSDRSLRRLLDDLQPLSR